MNLNKRNLVLVVLAGGRQNFSPLRRLDPILLELK